MVRYPFETQTYETGERDLRVGSRSPEVRYSTTFIIKYEILSLKKSLSVRSLSHLFFNVPNNYLDVRLNATRLRLFDNDRSC